MPVIGIIRRCDLGKTLYAHFLRGNLCDCGKQKQMSVSQRKMPEKRNK